MLTKFQKNAVEAIRERGNVLYAQGDDSGKGRAGKGFGEKAVDGEGNRINVLNPDGRTFGRIGRATIGGLIDSGYMVMDPTKPGRFELTGKE